ncbi:MAG: thioesterase family protein [Roseiarcus sp.]|jgi:4-hydroxybenzoyl-CoA thioesterase
MGFAFTRNLTIEWGHCDPAGIVFNPRFFEFFDWSTALLVQAALDLGEVDMRTAYGVAGIPLVDTRANFTRPARYGDRIEIVSRVSAVGRSSFEIDHKLFNAGELAVEGHEKRVWTVRDPQTGQLRSRPLPEEVARKLNGG